MTGPRNSLKRASGFRGSFAFRRTHACTPVIQVDWGTHVAGDTNVRQAVLAARISDSAGMRGPIVVVVTGLAQGVADICALFTATSAAQRAAAAMIRATRPLSVLGMTFTCATAHPTAADILYSICFFFIVRMRCGRWIGRPDLDVCPLCLRIRWSFSLNNEVNPFWYPLQLMANGGN